MQVKNSFAYVVLNSAAAVHFGLSSLSILEIMKGSTYEATESQAACFVTLLPFIR